MPDTYNKVDCTNSPKCKPANEKPPSYKTARRVNVMLDLKPTDLSLSGSGTGSAGRGIIRRPLRPPLCRVGGILTGGWRRSASAPGIAPRLSGPAGGESEPGMHGGADSSRRCGGFQPHSKAAANRYRTSGGPYGRSIRTSVPPRRTTAGPPRSAPTPRWRGVSPLRPVLPERAAGALAH